MRISTFAGQRPDEMKFIDQVHETSLDQLAEIICKVAWSPFLFENDQDAGRPRRHRSLFQATDFVVYDVDEDLSISQAIESCKDQAVMIATTKSHQIEKKSGSKIKPPCDRFRVIKFLERPITTESEYLATWIREAKTLGCVDEQCKDTARFYFPCKEVIYSNNGLLTLVSQPSFEPVQTSEINEQPAKQKQSHINDGRQDLKGRLFKSTLDFIQNGTEQNWHIEILKAAMDLKEQGFSYEDTVQLLNRATKKFDGSLDEHDMQVIEDVFQHRGGKYEKRSYADNPSKSPVKFVPPSDEELAKSYVQEAALRRRATQNSLTFLDPAIDEHFKITYGITLIGGKTGNGKSTVCHNLISQVLLSERCSKRILLLSNEETLVETYSKLACLMLGLNWKADYRNGTDPALQQLIDATAERLISRVTIVTSNVGEYDTSDLDDVKRMLDHATAESEKYALVIIDYLQTITTWKSHPGADTWKISKDLGSYLKKYAQTSEIPVIVFAQLWPESDTHRDFGNRVQNDKNFANHAHTCLEIIPDHVNLQTKIRCHKQRWGDLQNWEVDLDFKAGRLVAPAGD